MLRIGLIGASRVATYAVIAAAKELEDVEVVAVAARDSDRARQYADEHGIARAYGDYAALIADPEVDLVYIGTPPALHVEQALAVIAAGKPVLVEKPFALTAADAQLVHDTGKAAGVPVFEAMHSPHHKLFHRILEILHGGQIGTIRHIDAKFTAPIGTDDPIRWNAALGGGALMDLGVYPLAWLRRIAGEQFAVENASADLREGVDASFIADLSFPDGPTARIEASMVSPDIVVRMTVEGDRGTLKVINPLSPQRGHKLTLINGEGERDEVLEGAPSSYQAQLSVIAAALRGDAPYPYPSDDYVRSMTAIEQVRAGWADR